MAVSLNFLLKLQYETIINRFVEANLMTSYYLKETFPEKILSF